MFSFFKNFSQQVTALGVSEDGKFVSMGYADGLVDLWDIDAALSTNGTYLIYIYIYEYICAILCYDRLCELLSIIAYIVRSDILNICINEKDPISSIYE